MHVGVAGEDGDAGTAGVGDLRRLRRLVVPAEFDQGVDAGAQGALVVGVLPQGAVGVGQGAPEVVPGGGEGGQAGERLVVVGAQGEGGVERLAGLRVPGRVALGAGLLDVGEPEGGPTAEVLRLGAQVGLERGDPASRSPPASSPGDTAADVVTARPAPSRRAPTATAPAVIATASRAAQAPSCAARHRRPAAPTRRTAATRGSPPGASGAGVAAVPA
ncbi:hypothetical protein [Streptomyces galbus]|uniref:hypothetical protein n=1 Tax=Streptomyces galbus TaxID=33898 RepID=UPI003EC0FDC8